MRDLAYLMLIFALVSFGSMVAITIRVDKQGKEIVSLKKSITKLELKVWDSELKVKERKWGGVKYFLVLSIICVLILEVNIFLGLELTYREINNLNKKIELLERKWGLVVNHKEILLDLLPFFPTAKLYKDEIIIEPKNNLYFLLSDVKDPCILKCKIIEWLSRSACKGLSNYWQSYIRRGLNSYFKKNFSKEDWDLIYTKLGNCSNRKLSINFVLCDLDLKILKNG